MTSASRAHRRDVGIPVVRETLVSFLTPVVGGVLLACCFLPPPAHWLAWISLVPIAAAIAQKRRVVATYAGMYCAGFIFNLITTDWIRTLDGGTGLSGTSAPDWLLQSQLLALFWPMTLFLGRSLVSLWLIPMSLALPATWVIHELLLRSLWAIVDATGWHVYFLGYAVVEHRYMSQIADLGGVSALTFAAACASGAVWDSLGSVGRRDGNNRPRFIALTGVGMAVLLLIFCYAYGAWAVNNTQFTEGPNVWLMPEEILRDPPVEMPWQTGASEAPGVLLWSELAYHGQSADFPRPTQATLAQGSEPVGRPTASHMDTGGDVSQRALENLARQFGVPLVIGYTRTDPIRAAQIKYNSVAFVDPRQGFQGSYDKVGLVPWTEFTPLKGLTSRKCSQFSHGTTCPVFELLDSTAEKSYRFASAICYDVAFSRLFRRDMRAAEGPPEFFLVCSSERTDRTGRLSRHVLNMAKVRAIECRRALVRNVHFGYSGRIDSTGLLCDASLPQVIEAPTSLGSIPIDRRSSVYAFCGDWIPAVIIGMAAAAVGFKLRRRGAKGA